MVTIKIYGLVALISLIVWLMIGIAEVKNNPDKDVPLLVIVGYAYLIMSMLFIVLLGAGLIH